MKAKIETEMPKPVRVEPLERIVRRVDRSPMNPLRWCFDLECGHEEWITSKSKPTRKTMQCSKCTAGTVASLPVRCEANAPTESGICAKPARYNVLEMGISIATCSDCAEQARKNGYVVVNRPNEKLSD